MKFDLNRLDELTAPVWEGNKVVEETVLFLGKDEKKQLLYTPDEILSVKSFDLTREFVKDKDYRLVDGHLELCEDTEIPFFAFDEYYNDNFSDSLQTLVNGGWKNTYWGEALKVKGHQAAVTYTHSDKWERFIPADESANFKKFLGKLERGENATVFYYGDSITAGANASGRDKHEPFMPTWSELVTLGIAKKYGYTVHFVVTDFINGSILSREDVSFGDRGVLTMVNTAVGGWRVENGIESFEVHCDLFIRKFGCDLLVLAFGMNDKRHTGEEEKELVSQLAGMFLEIADPDVMLVATMLPNPEANERWNLNQKYFEKEFYDIAKELREKGVGAAVAPMTSMSAAVLERKFFRDWTGNNINHPNDFMVRIYASTLLKTLLG